MWIPVPEPSKHGFKRSNKCGVYFRKSYIYWRDANILACKWGISKEFDNFITAMKKHNPHHPHSLKCSSCYQRIPFEATNTSLYYILHRWHCPRTRQISRTPKYPSTAALNRYKSDPASVCLPCGMFFWTRMEM